MKKNYRLCTLISVLAGYLELVGLVWWYFEEHHMLRWLALYFILGISGLLNLLFWGGYAVEKWYAKKRNLKGWLVPKHLIIPGLVLNLAITILGSGALVLWLRIYLCSFSSFFCN